MLNNNNFVNSTIKTDSCQIQIDFYTGFPYTSIFIQQRKPYITPPIYINFKKQELRNFTLPLNEVDYLIKHQALRLSDPQHKTINATLSSMPIKAFLEIDPYSLEFAKRELIPASFNALLIMHYVKIMDYKIEQNNQFKVHKLIQNLHEQQTFY